MGVPTDPIADFLTRVRNASRAGKERLTAPGSKLTLRIAEVLKAEGYLENVKLVEEGPKRFLRIHLKYTKEKAPAIRSLVRISKPGLKRYVNSKNLPRVLNGLGLAILTTSKGVMTDQQARRERIGGEVLCKVW